MGDDLPDFREVQDHFGFARPAPIEKDWYITRAIAALTAMDAGPFALVFGGGTCLARAHRLVRRMSEDVDFKIVPREGTPSSRGTRRKQLGDLRDRVTETLQRVGFLFNADDPAHVSSRNESRYTIYRLPHGPPGREEEGLRPAIQLELTYARLRQPAVTLPVSSFVAEAYRRPPEVPSIACVSVTETAAEKLVSLTRRTAAELAGMSRDPDPTLVRHIYDLHLIRGHLDREAFGELAWAIAGEDAEAFRNQHPAYHADVAAETGRALDALRTDPLIRDRYAHFVSAMVYGERPIFDDAITTVIGLAGPLIRRR